MDVDMELAKGDTRKTFREVVTDAEGNPRVLTGAETVKFWLRHADGRGGTAKVNGADGDVVTAAGGVIGYDQEAADVNEAGLFFYELEVTHADGTKQRLPETGFKVCLIRETLG